MRRLVVTSLLIACTGLTAACGVLEADAGSLERSSLETFTGKGYRIELPCSPDKSTHSVPTAGEPALTLDTWMCEDADSAFGVATTRIPAAIRFDLDGAAQGAADALDGTVVSNTKVTYAGSPGRDLRIESTVQGKPTTMFIRVLIRKRVTYQVQGLVIGEHTTKPPALYRKILKSLSFT